MTSMKLNLVVALMAGTALAQPAFAQETAAPEAASTSEGGLEEIVVTAQKRAENLQTVPLAVSAVTAQTFERFASRSIADVSGSMPNVYVGSAPTPGGSSIVSFAIRGLSYAENEKTIEPPIGVVLDGVFIGTAQGGLLQSFDLERVEVLRGPQGTLFGKNTTGGAINAVRTRPTGRFGIRAAGTIGTMGRREFRAVVNFPIAEGVLAGKASFSYEALDGIKNLLFNRRDGKRDYWSATATLLFTPTETFEALLTYDHSKDRSDSWPTISRYISGPTIIPTIPPLTILGDTPCRVLNFCPPFDPKHSRVNRTQIAHADLDALTLSAKLELSDDIDLVSVTGWRKSVENVLTDFDATELLIFQSARPHEPFEQFTQEIRLEGGIGDRINFVAGLFYYDGHYETRVVRTQDLGYIRGNPALIGVRSQFFPDATISAQTIVDHRAKSYAAFAQADIEVVDNLTLTLGGRYTKDRKKILYQLLNPDGSLLGPAQGALFPQTINTKASWSKFTPRVAVKYEFNPVTIAYASFTQGYNAGGFSGRAPDVSSVGPYNPEKVNAYEVGVKTEVLDRKLRLNLALFRTDYKDKQQEVSRAISIPPFFGTTVTNAASARIQGVEAEATAVPMAGLTLSGSVGYLDAKYRDFVGNITGQLVTDNSNLKIVRTPDWTASASADYNFDLAGGTVDMGARLRYVDDMELIVTNDPLGHTRPVAYLDASLGYGREIGNVQWKLKVYGRNLTDKLRASTATRIGGFLDFLTFNRGREGGVELSVKY